MKRLTVILLLFISSISYADEGMWLVHLLKQQTYYEMKQRGLRISIEQLYSENHPSIKDAVVSIDGGRCTGSVVSMDGLMLTNFHCCVDDISKLSSIENNYLQNGFKAEKYDEEIRIPDKTVSFLVKVVDVTEEYNKLLISHTKRKAEAKIVSKYARIAKNSIVLKSMRSIRKHYLYFYKTYKDVRLVCVPPSSIANFGGNVDNFVWPQHKCDFIALRVYGDENGKPADYSDKNIPIKPKYALPISKHSVKDGDFTFMFGYPFITNRCLSSYKIKERRVRNGMVIKVRKPIMDILYSEMSKDEKVNLQYSGIFHNYSNLCKNLDGENENIDKSGLISLKRAKGENLKLSEINTQFTDSIIKYQSLVDFTREAFVKGSNVMAFAFSLRTLLHGLTKMSGSDAGFIGNYKKKYDNFNSGFSEQVERKMLVKLIETYLNNVETKYYPKYLYKLVEESNYNISLAVDYLFNNSVIYNYKQFSSVIISRDADLIKKDPFYKFTLSVLEVLNSTRHVLSYYKKKYKETFNVDVLYPDANSTMRVTYGTVGGYSSIDALSYKYRTTLEGINEKCNDENDEYKIPLYIYMKYLYSLDASLQTCFITNNDIVAGNSGSPVLNCNGELVGIACDGNKESMAGTLYYNSVNSKAICVDINYIQAIYPLD